MKKILYLTISYKHYSKKIHGQIHAFYRSGLEVFLCCYHWKEEEYQLLRYLGEKDGEYLFEKYFSVQKKQGYRTCFLFAKEVLTRFSFDILYIRRLGISVLFYGGLIRRIKSRGISLIYEIPTYPFEIQDHWKKAAAQKLEVFFLEYAVFPYTDCIPVYCSRLSPPMRPQMLAVENSVEAAFYTGYRDLGYPEEGKVLRMLAIAYVQKWHGYDMLLRAMKAYRGDWKLSFTLCGNPTEETPRLAALAQELGLANVYFVREDEIGDPQTFFAGFHLGIGALGIGRKGGKQTPGEHREDSKKNSRDETYPNVRSNEKKEEYLDTSIKNKEYCAMGLPFIHGDRDISFDPAQSFHYQTEIRNGELDLEAVIRWYSCLEKQGLRKEMYAYAEQRLDFMVNIRRILEYCGREGEPPAGHR